MDKIEKNMTVYRFAKEFLNEIMERNGVPQQTLKKQLDETSEFRDLKDANKRLIESLTNRNMMLSVIGFKDKEPDMSIILHGFEPELILQHYEDSDKLFEAFRAKFSIRNAQSKKNLWRKFAEGILSGSRFMATFRNKQEFDNFVKTFALNRYTKAALPMLISLEIDGFGFPLACDFLKELGYRDYPKPDVHLKAIFSELGLSDTNADYDVYKSIVEMSEIVKEDAYVVDKIFWLIGSGNFYLDGIKIGSHRKQFITEANKRLTLM